MPERKQAKPAVVSESSRRILQCFAVSHGLSEPAMKRLLSEFDEFYTEAAALGFAGSGDVIKKDGFKVFEQRKGQWFYREKWSGSLQSWGQTIISVNSRLILGSRAIADGMPFWTKSYGGGIEPEFLGNADLKKPTHAFLKQALLNGLEQYPSVPRGPELYIDSENFPGFEYCCELRGDMIRFSGVEHVLYRKSRVFTHWFHGGLYLPK